MNRMPMCVAAALLLAAACSAPAHADEACEAKAMDQASINACAHRDLQAVDAELNRVYRTILKRHAGKPVFLAKLKAAQRTWIESRDRDLEAKFPLAPDEVPQVVYGSMYPYEYANAKAELTRSRSAYLRGNFLDGSAP